MREISQAASIQIEAECLNQAERESRLRQEIAELKSRRQRLPPDTLENLKWLEENLRSTAKELTIAHVEVAGLQREHTVLKSTIDRL